MNTESNMAKIFRRFFTIRMLKKYNEVFSYSEFNVNMRYNFQTYKYKHYIF